MRPPTTPAMRSSVNFSLSWLGSLGLRVHARATGQGPLLHGMIARRRPGHSPLPFHYGPGPDGYRLIERLRQTLMTRPA
jgi:hypothetical protein